MTPEQQAAIARAEALARATARLEASGAAQGGGQGGSTAPAAATPPDGPVGAGRAGVLQRAAGRMGPVVSGVGDALIKGALGVKSLVTDLSEADRLALQGMREEAARDTGWAGAGRMAGEIGTNIAATAVPGAKLGGALARTMQARRGLQAIAPVASAAAVSGLSGAVLTPSESEGAAGRFADKGQQGLVDAATGGVLQAGGSMLRRAGTGMFRPTADAVKLMDQGIVPTLSQGAESRFGRSVGSLAAGASRVRGRQQEEIADSLFRRITEGNRSTPQGTGNEYVTDAQQYVSQQYDDVFGNTKYLISPALVGRAAGEIAKLNRVGGGADASQQAQRILKDTVDDALLGKRGTRMTQREIQDLILVKLRQKADKTGDQDVVDAVERARKVILNSVYAKLTPEQLMRVKDVDRLNYDLSRLREATAGGRAEDVGVDVTRLKTVYGNAKEMTGQTTKGDLVGPLQRTLGPAPAQLGRGDVVTAGRFLAPLGLGGIAYMSSNPWLASPLALGYGISTIGQTRRGARLLMGQTAAQKKAAEALRNISPYLYGSGQAVGTDLPPEE